MELNELENVCNEFISLLQQAANTATLKENCKKI